MAFHGLFLAVVLILGSVASFGNISKERLIQIAHSNVQDADNSFLNSRLRQDAVLEHTLFEYRDFSTVHFKLIDHKQEELYSFCVQMLTTNGNVIPPVSGVQTFGKTFREWEPAFDNFCYFHPDDFRCYVTPI